jgi:putative transposase
MPRQARFVLPGHLHHVTQRGNYRQNIFKDTNDRIFYLKLINHYAKEYLNEIFAFCLMSNHVHFIIKPQNKDSLAGIFCRAHQQYSLYFHKKNGINGHLWQERFYSCLLEGNHVLKAIQYVECNPVRANMVQFAWDYSWSSVHFHLGKIYNIIELSDSKPYIQTSDWKKFLVDGLLEADLKSIRHATAKGNVFGSEDYINELERKYHRTLTPRPIGRPTKKSRACHDF